jgi:thiopeptide-type bacteriocin biosynthesis protein
MKSNNGVANVRYIAARTPLMPTHVIVDIFESQDPIFALRHELQTNPLMRQCIMVASPSLGEAMRTWLSGREPRNKNTALRLLAYASRMAYRATPLGICAGIGFVSPGELTTANLQTQRRRSVTRPDMGLIGDLSERIEAGENRSDVCYVTNEAVLERGGRLFITNTRLLGPGQTSSRQRSATLRNTEAASFVREIARDPIPYGAIVGRLADRFEARRDESEKLVDALIEARVLLSELTLSPIGDPVNAFQEKCRTIAPQMFADLSDALAQAAELDAQPMHERSDEAYDQALRKFSSMSPSVNTPVQIDMHAPLDGTLGRNVLRDVELMASYMVRMGAVTDLASYRERFIARFEGLERMVSLLELVDDNLGLGAPVRLEERPRSTEARSQFVMQLAQESLINGVGEVVLKPKDVEKLLYAPDPQSDPDTIELGFQVAASSTEAINTGSYLVVPSSYGGIMQAGRSLGRFMHLFGERDVECIHALSHEIEDGGHITAEIVYPPSPARLYNVAIRPRVYHSEIQIGLRDSSAPHRIPLDDLWVGIDNNRFFLWSKSHECRVQAVESHVLNTGRNAPNLCRLLACISADGKTTMRGFDWGPASVLRTLPRIRCGRIVLSLQRWRIPIGDLGDSIESARKAVSCWRTTWAMPRHVHLRQSDNRLFLDLDSSVTPSLLLDQVSKQSHEFEFIEALPGPSDVWMRGKDGGHVAEFVCAMVLPKGPQAITSAKARPIETYRSRWAPGSEWVYAKLYVPVHAADDLLVRNVSPLVEDLRRKLSVDRWFFVRYDDAMGFHVRLRLHSDSSNATALRESFLFAAEQWFRDDRITRYVLDTYDPEYERYGGVENLEATERFFTYDSDTCLALLKSLSYDDDARVAAAVESFLKWLLTDRTLLERALVVFEKTGRQKIAKADREALRKLRDLSVDESEHSGLPDLLRTTNADSLAAFFHMHCNRLEVQGESETRAGALLRAAVLAIVRKHEAAMV